MSCVLTMLLASRCRWEGEEAELETRENTGGRKEMGVSMIVEDVIWAVWVGVALSTRTADAAAVEVGEEFWLGRRGMKEPP